GIGEVFVFALSEAVPRHDDAAAEATVIAIERRDRAALRRRQYLLQDGATLLVEIVGHAPPIDRVDALRRRTDDRRRSQHRRWSRHAAASRRSRAFLRSTPQR